MAAHWADEVVGAVDRWVRATGQPSGGVSRWRRLGEAVPGRDPGWLVLDLRDQRRSPDSLGPLCFADPSGPDRGALQPVDEVRIVDGVVHLKAPPDLPARLRHVWVQTMSPHFLVEKLASGLRAAQSAPLAEDLAARRVAGAPTDTTSVPGLLPAQQDALRACLSPGVRLVWGPPGTGKTKVLALAIQEHLRRGHRVLLVSTANVAVDNALIAVLATVSGHPGSVVRVGPAQLPAVATNAGVQLDLLAARRSTEVDRERAELSARLGELDEIDAAVVRLQAELDGHDHDAYLAAADRVDGAAAVEALQSAARAAEERITTAVSRVDSARAALVTARRDHAAVAGERAAHEHWAVLSAELRQLDDAHRAAVLARDVAAARSVPRGWWERRRHDKEVRRAAEDAESVSAASAVRRRELLDLHMQAKLQAGTVTPADLSELDRRLASARHRVESAEAECAAARAGSRSVQRELDRARGSGPPSSVDVELVREARSNRCSERMAELEQAVRRQSAEGHRRSGIERRMRELTERARTLRAGAEQQLVREARLVATTLARSRVHPAVASDTFDVVLVDEAGAASLAEVLLALCRARTTAVLLGDFLQLEPVHDGPIAKDPDPGVATWIRGTCFSHVDIGSPQEAIRHAGCIALTAQFRFGPELRQLANDVAYEVLEDGRSGTTTDIVLVDVSTVPDLAVLRAGAGSGFWWVAGIVVAGALAELHVTEGPVGVVTPYRKEADAVLAALRDRGIVAGAFVGTAHATQGQEYDTVVLDTVDLGDGWIAKGRRDRSPYEYAGLRLFGVGITRARHRLYVLADANVVRTAATGPFAALRRALDRGHVQVWSAAALLGHDEPPAGPVDATFAEVAELLAQLVTITDVHDERTFGAELAHQLENATTRVWMWSPWIARRAAEVVPLIGAAIERGVAVTVFLRPDDDRNIATAYAQDRLRELEATGAVVIRSKLEHRKIVVVDGASVLLGSLNPLSAPPNSTREVMLTMRGRAFADRLLEELRVQEIGTPRLCPQCGRTMEVRRQAGKHTSELYWRCPDHRQRPAKGGRR